MNIHSQIEEIFNSQQPIARFTKLCCFVLLCFVVVALHISWSHLPVPITQIVVAKAQTNTQIQTHTWHVATTALFVCTVYIYMYICMCLLLFARVVWRQQFTFTPSPSKGRQPSLNFHTCCICHILALCLTLTKVCSLCLPCCCLHRWPLADGAWRVKCCQQFLFPGSCPLYWWNCCGITAVQGETFQRKV